MNRRYLQLAPRVSLPTARLTSRVEIEAWAAERRQMLGELVEREGLGRQLTLDDRRAA